MSLVENRTETRITSMFMFLQCLMTGWLAFLAILLLSITINYGGSCLAGGTRCPFLRSKNQQGTELSKAEDCRTTHSLELLNFWGIRSGAVVVRRANSKDQAKMSRLRLKGMDAVRSFVSRDAIPISSRQKSEDRRLAATKGVSFPSSVYK